MESARHGQLVLAEFTRLFLSPAASRALEITTSDFDLVTFANLVEVIGWLSLGVEIGIFDPDYAGDLVLARAPDLRAKHPAFSKKWGFLFPELEMLPIERAIRNQEPYPRSFRGFEEPTTLHPSFVMAATLACRFALSAAARWLSLTLNFLNDQQWGEMLGSPVRSTRIAEAFRSLTSGVIDIESHRWLMLWRERKTVSSVGEALEVIKTTSMASCMVALQHMQWVISFFHPENRASDVMRSDWATLRIRVAETHGWRLNFVSGPSRARFRTLWSELANVVSTGLTPDDGFLDLRQFDGAIESLIGGWNSLRLKGSANAR